MTKRRVQGGGATSERRRRDGVSGKSHLRGFSPPVSATPTNALRALVHSRVHELVARAMRGKCVRHWLMVQVSSFALTTTSTIPRVRTYHTRKPSRFVHALPARPLKVRELTDLRSKRGRRRRDRVSGRGEVCTLTKSGHFATLNSPLCH